MLREALLWLAALLTTASLSASGYVLFFAAVGIRERRRVLLAGLAFKPIPSPATRFVLVIPAHNEGAGLLPTLASVAQSSYPQALRQVIVVADNCTDQTAAIARGVGAVVWEREDRLHPGKGQALAWAFRRAQALHYDMIAVVDADTTVHAGFFAGLDRAYQEAAGRGQPALALQGRYEFAAAESPGSAASAGRLAQASNTTPVQWFNALTVSSKAAENSFIYQPRSALGLVTLLQGNGFAVSREALVQVPFEAGSVVEDAEYALDLALAGIPVVYVDGARVTSRMTSRVADAAPQRLRWAGGIFQLLARFTPLLLRQAIASRNWRLVEAAAMLMLTSRLMLIYLTASALLLLPLAAHTHWMAPLASLLLLGCLLQSAYLWLVLRWSSATPMPVRTIVFLPAYLGMVGFAQGCAALGIRRGRWHRTVR